MVKRRREEDGKVGNSFDVVVAFVGEIGYRKEEYVAKNKEKKFEKD